MPFQPFIVVANGKEQEGYPTPALIQAAAEAPAHFMFGRSSVEAYRHPETGFWRLRDDKYDAPGTEYTKVTIKHVSQFYVDLEVELIETGSDDADREPFVDTVYVVAEDETEARALAPGKAAEYWQEREGPNVGVSTTTIRVKDHP